MKNEPLLKSLTACIEKVERWVHDNKHFVHKCPEAEPLLEALRHTLETGEFETTPAGMKAQALARNEFKLSKAEETVFANRIDPVANLPNVQKFTALIAEQNEILKSLPIPKP